MASPPTSPRGTRYHTGRGGHDYLDPAVDGPPSPERLRAISRQVKQEKHSSQFSTSSGSSSWEHSLAEQSLSRSSSQRSVSGSGPSRDRPDSVSMFSKSIFSRRPKMRRDASEPNLPNNALFPPGMSAEPMPMPPAKDRSMSAFFARRKSAKESEIQAAQRKVQISGPYNFKHLTHTQKDNIPNLQQTSRTDLVSEFSCIRASQKPTKGSLKGIQADDIQYQEYPSDILCIQDFEPELSQEQLELEIDPRDTTSRNSSHRDSFLPRIRPQSSLEDSIMAPFSPPPRVSSRTTSTQLDNFELVPSNDPERLAPVPGPPRRQSEPHIHMASRRAEPAGQTLAVTTPADSSWPLCASAMTSVPELPEEEESPVSPKNASVKRRTSLRGSVSVPALHRLSVSQSRPPQVIAQQGGALQRASSNASDTLGEFNVVSIRQAPRASVSQEGVMDDSFFDWEDDIDYCYEHAAEADCDYAWERPSVDLHQQEKAWETGSAVDYRISAINSPEIFSPNVLSPRTSQDPIRRPSEAFMRRPSYDPSSRRPSYDPSSRHPSQDPIRSPPAPTSNPGQSRSVTPAGAAAPVTSNFSLPHRAHNRTLSRSDSFHDRARGVSQSPTFFVSNDYRSKIPEYDEREEYEDSDDDEDFLTHLPPVGSSMRLDDKKTTLLNVRSSASTDTSLLSDRSLASSRHKSNGSINTALTGWTASSTCASLDGWQNCEPSPTNISVVVNDEQTVVMRAKEDGFASASPLPSPTRPTSRDHGHERHRSDADLLTKFSAPSGTSTNTNNNTKETPKARRRARTISRGNNSPQLALFPHVPPNGRS